jgi:NAD(P)-dependent dehydrogenase (short-subunit alcohol dehydrogenase family)
MPTVLITGANRGIGLEFARQYSADGWDVIATARQSSDELDSLEVRVEPLELTDVETVASFGERLDGLDLLIANAGTWIPEQAESADDGHGWADMMLTNCIAPYLLAKSVLRHVASVKGKLIALTSGMGSIGESSGGYDRRGDRPRLGANADGRAGRSDSARGERRRHAPADRAAGPKRFRRLPQTGRLAPRLVGCVRRPRPL